MVFDNASIELKRNGKYILCGASGSGKSTLVKLITGSVYPGSGRICVDGMDIHRFSPEQYARFILPCTQNTFIFNASLRDNVTLFDKCFSEKDILTALETVEFSYVLERYDDGLDHMIAQGGQTLSGGERQKIALARMELFDPQVVIFDESYANLDKETTQRLIDLAVANKQRTVILISHQISNEIASCFDKKIAIRDSKMLSED